MSAPAFTGQSSPLLPLQGEALPTRQPARPGERHAAFDSLAPAETSPAAGRVASGLGDTALGKDTPDPTDLWDLRNWPEGSLEHAYLTRVQQGASEIYQDPLDPNAFFDFDSIIRQGFPIMRAEAVAKASTTGPVDVSELVRQGVKAGLHQGFRSHPTKARGQAVVVPRDNVTPMARPAHHARHAHTGFFSRVGVHRNKSTAHAPRHAKK